MLAFLPREAPVANEFGTSALPRKVRPESRQEGNWIPQAQLNWDSTELGKSKPDCSTRIGVVAGVIGQEDEAGWR